MKHLFGKDLLSELAGHKRGQRWLKVNGINFLQGDASPCRLEKRFRIRAIPSRDRFEGKSGQTGFLEGPSPKGGEVGLAHPGVCSGDENPFHAGNSF